MSTEIKSALIQVIDWRHAQHPSINMSNTPCNTSLMYLKALCSEIIIPTQSLFGHIEVTYGFTSHELLKWVTKNSPDNIAPKIDQHASMELNSKGNRICKRDGAACDFYIQGYEQRMDEVAKYICANIEFDRLYFYGKDRPIHISIGTENTRYALIREKRSDGLRVNKKRAKGSATRTLFDNL